MMLTAREFHMRETVPLHLIQAAILEFCRGREDAVVFGAQAVNLYVGQPRMSQDVDLLSPEPGRLAELLRTALAERFSIASRVREVKAGKGFRIYQVHQPGNRHLADVRLAEFSLEDRVERDGIRYVSLPLLVALKTRALSRRRLAPKGATDLADLRRLLLAHPEVRTRYGAVEEALQRIGSEEEVFETWAELVQQPLVSDEETDEGY